MKLEQLKVGYPFYACKGVKCVFPHAIIKKIQILKRVYTKDQVKIFLTDTTNFYRDLDWYICTTVDDDFYLSLEEKEWYNKMDITEEAPGIQIYEPRTKPYYNNWDIFKLNLQAYKYRFKKFFHV